MNITGRLLAADERQSLKDRLLSTSDDLVRRIPKAELHVHLEGMMLPELRWKFAQRNGMKISMGKEKNVIENLHDLEMTYASIISSSQLHRFQDRPPPLIPPTFFEAYYSGIEVIKTRQDFCEVAMDYFQRASAMNVRYSEMFFDPQAHTRRGISWEDMMGGLSDAQEKALRELDIRSAWIMCLLRDESPASAMEHYEAALPYRDMIIGIGLDSNEHRRPPNLFTEVFQRARQDGFKITAHCDVGQQDTHDHIRQLLSPPGGISIDRIDHGLNAADKTELVELIASQDIGMTICPWAYLRRFSLDEIGSRLRVLLDAGVKICISSDDPPYMDDTWIIHNMLLARNLCHLTDADIVKIAKDAVEISWAGSEVKERILAELNETPWQPRGCSM